MHHIPQLGLHDSLLVTDTTAVSGGNYCAIQIVEANTVFSVLTGTISLQGVLGNAVFVPGEIIYGNFTAFTLASGAVIAYNAKD